jgi:hypothetical protein
MRITAFSRGAARKRRRVRTAYRRLTFSHRWFATVQDVLQADWQDVWHSPQPLPAVVLRSGLAIVLIYFFIA